MYVIAIHQLHRRTDKRTDDILIAVRAVAAKASSQSQRQKLKNLSSYSAVSSTVRL